MPLNCPKAAIPMYDPARLTEFLRAKVPPAALPHCVSAIMEHPVSITIERKRATKWGDYRIRPFRPPEITVNHDLPPRFFLLTLLHEIAHHRVHVQYGIQRVAPHGIEWKRAFVALVVPVLNVDVFGESMLPLLRTHLRNPKANATADQNLYREYLSQKGQSSLLIEQLAPGDRFRYRTREFVVTSQHRKRIACVCQLSSRTYLFQPLTPVVRVESAHT